MSLMVLAIAAIPAVFVAVIASSTGSRAATLLTALVAAAVGLLTGNPAYIALDLACVAIAVWLTWPPADSEKIEAAAAKRAAKKAYYESAEYKRKENLWVGGIGVIVVGGYFLNLFWPIVVAGKPTPAPSSVVVTASPSRPIPALPTIPPANVSSVPNPGTVKVQQSSRPRKVEKTPFQKCVDIRDEKKMQECLESLE